MKVCFVAENAYPVFASRSQRAFGGMETQAWAFACGLQQLHCCDVSFAVSTPYQFRSEIHSGIVVWNRPAFFESLRRDVARNCRISHSWPFVQMQSWSNSLIWKLPLLVLSKPFRASDREQQSIVRFYSRLPVDTIVAYGVSSLTTLILEAARAAGKRTILSCASNDDLRAEYRSVPGYVNAYGERADVLYRGLQSADQIIVQTTYQQELASRNLGLQSVVVPNPIDEVWTNWAQESPELLKDLFIVHPELEGPFVLWTGRTERFHKRPAMAFEVARNLPHRQFVMVLNETDPRYAAELKQECPGNVLILPIMPHSRFVALLSRATAFLSTGSGLYEGFPNVFLQAGVLGVPVVSADCDFGILSDTGIGRSFGDSVTAMSEFLEQLCGSDVYRTQILNGVAARTAALFGRDRVATCLWNVLKSEAI